MSPSPVRALSGVLAALLLISLAAGASSRDRNGGNPPLGGDGSTEAPPPPDILATVPVRLFPRPAQISTDTRLWTNRGLHAAGGATTISQIQRVNIVCELESATTLMTLRISSMSTGEVRFEQTTQSLAPLAPGRTMRLVIPAETNLVLASDGAGTLEIPLPDNALAVLRRAGDIWSPMLTALGQFASFSEARPVTFNGRPCLAIRMQEPRLPGLLSGTLYLDAATFMPVGQETNMVRDILISGRTTILEWQTVAGIQVPKVIRLEGTDGTATLRFTSVSFITTSGPLG